MESIEDILEELQRLKVQSIRVYDGSDRSLFADCFIIGTVDNLVQMEAARTKIADLLRPKRIFLKNPLEEWHGGWCLLDFGNVIIHLMLDEMRSFYNLEGLFQASEYPLIREI